MTGVLGGLVWLPTQVLLYSLRFIRSAALLYFVSVVLDHIHLKNHILKDEYKRIYRREYTPLYNRLLEQLNQRRDAA